MSQPEHSSHSSDAWDLPKSTRPFDLLSEARRSAGGCPSPTKNVGDAERWASVAAGVGLAGLGLLRGRWSGLALAAMGGGLLWRGLTGRCQCYAVLGINTTSRQPATAARAQHGCKLERTIRIDCPAADLYRFWRRLENLPRVMRHLKAVEPVDSLRSHWKAEGALAKDVEWDAEIINEHENEMIAWRSLPGGDVDTAGSIHFKPLESGGSTEVTLSMKYDPPAGKLAARVASILGDGLEQRIDEDLEQFKQAMETGMEAAPAG